MDKEQFHKILDEHAEWKLGTGEARGQPRSEETARPGNEFPMVSKFVSKERQCNWCGLTADKKETLSRNFGSKIWKAKCSECGKKVVIHNRDIFKDKY